MQRPEPPELPPYEKIFYPGVTKSRHHASLLQKASLNLQSRSIIKMNQSTFNELYLSQWQQLYGLALRILASEEDAADAVQDVFEKLLEESGRLAEVESPKAYAITLTRRRCIDLLRRRNIRAAVPLEDAPPLARDCHDTEQRSSAEYLRSCIESLPAGQATVMKLRVYAELDNKEIARETGFSDETVRQQLSRARRKLKELLNRTK